MFLSTKKQNPEKRLKNRGFTLPEVIISFTIMAMVVTSAVSVLSLVIRTNSDNVGSLVANGLAQEGIEAVRFIRDSDVILGLDFDGGRGESVLFAWGEKLYDSNFSEPRYFKLINKDQIAGTCSSADLQNCLPVSLEEIGQVDLDNLDILEDARVFIDKKDGGAGFKYFQKSGQGISSEGSNTQYHRVIRIEPLKVPEDNPEINAMRVNSIVTWSDANNRTKKVVLTTDLTNFR